MIAKNTSRRRVAIIRNYKLDGQWGQDMLDSFSKLILAAEPYAVVQHFQPIDGGPLPEASNYDLVILTGGTYDLTQPEVDIWVAALLDWIRNTVASSPQTKLLGICWGHQAIAHALGGKIAYREGGTLVSLTARILSRNCESRAVDVPNRLTLSTFRSIRMAKRSSKTLKL